MTVEYANALEALAQFNDLWRGVRGYHGADLRRYPTGGFAIWARFDGTNEAVPETWLGYPVVAVIGSNGDAA